MKSAAVNIYVQVYAQLFRHLNLSPGCAPGQMNKAAVAGLS